MRLNEPEWAFVRMRECLFPTEGLHNRVRCRGYCTHIGPLSTEEKGITSGGNRLWLYWSVTNVPNGYSRLTGDIVCDRICLHAL